MLTREQKKDYAQKLYVNESGITQAEIAERVGASKKTISKWVNDGKWDELRVSLLVEKDRQLGRLYRQLKNWNDHVENRVDGEQFLLSKEADAVVKITASIKNLEVETNTAEKIETGKQFLNFLRRTCTVEESKRIADLFNAYIKSCL